MDVFRMSSEVGPMENLTPEWDLRPGEPRWGAEGRFVYFEAGVGGNAHLFRVPTSGDLVEQVTRGERRLSGISFSSSFERMAYAATDPVRPPEIFSARVDGSNELKITGFHDTLVEDVQLSPVEGILYPSKDGTEIEGWVLLPPGYQPAQGSLPVILSIHGGPHGAYGNRFSFQFQLWADPDSYHGGWSPWNTVHRYYQELEWWKKYLGSETEVTNGS
jgi:dipeptidyl aminopeptidase/acylaminoacyl peptidase